MTRGKRNKDFGQGFYTTHLHEQAVYWSKRIADRYGGTPEVTVFDFDLAAAQADGLNIKIFEKPDKEWALFVMANRRQEEKEFKHDYDIVIGPVANDRMARLFGLYDMEIIDLDAVVGGLIYKDLNSQYFFATERSQLYQEAMTQENNNFNFLVDYITTKVVEQLVKNEHLGIEEALLQFHNSETFDKLCEPRTDLYIESPAFIYELYKEELRRGSIRNMTE